MLQRMINWDGIIDYLVSYARRNLMSDDQRKQRAVVRLGWSRSNGHVPFLSPTSMWLAQRLILKHITGQCLWKMTPRDLYVHTHWYLALLILRRIDHVLWATLALPGYSSFTFRILYLEVIETQLHADSPSKYLSLLPFRQASKCYNISNIVVFVCLYRKLVGMLKRKENLTHSLTYLCSATYSINGKNSRFYPNTSNILALTRTSVSFVYVQTGQSFVPFVVRKLSNPQIRRNIA